MEHRFIKNKDLILFSFQAWESAIGFNFKDMAFELARYNRVLFVNRALDRNSVLRTADNKINALKKNVPGEDKSLQPVGDNLWLLNPGVILESVNWLPSFSLYNYFNRVNNTRLAGAINKAIEQLGFKDVILINDNDFFRGLYQKELLPACRQYIFYVRDFLTIQPFFKKYGPRMEKKMIEKADLVVANSAYLAKYARQWNKRSYDIGQGCDLENFLKDDLPKPEDMKSIPRPIIGYCGAITSMRLDVSILDHIAKTLPEYSLVLVGPVDADFDAAQISDLPNVFILGGKQPDTIQNYMYHFDICINPQAVNQLTIGNYPRKIDEYLALGKPVVATATDAMKMFEEYSFLCSTKEEYVDKIRGIFENKRLFSQEEKTRRRNFALEHTWENCIGALGDAYYHLEPSLKMA